MYFISEFCTKCLVSETLQTNERFYFCFIDYKKAFNAINREKLYMKLKYDGIQGNFLTVILSMYSRIIKCVRFSGPIYNFFENRVGLLQ